MVTYFDVETSALSEEEIAPFKPEFRADSRLKDLDKIKANIMEKEQAWRSELALSPLTGKILCVGFLSNDVVGMSDYENEDEIIASVLETIRDDIQSGASLVGFCCRTFDVPFIIRRAWKHKLAVPQCLFEGRYLSSRIVDIAERWGCGGREPRDRISLDNLAKFLGVGAKNGKGEDFAKLWANCRPAALDYLENDLRLTKLAYERLYTQP